MKKDVKKMKFELDEYHRNVSDDELLRDVLCIAKKLNKKTLTQREYKENGGKFGTNTFLRRFGYWNNVLKKVGLDKSLNRNVSEEELFKNIEEVWIKLGRQPKNREVIKPLSKYDYRTYNNRFGGWRKALESFVEYVNSEEGESSEAAIKKIEKAKYPTQHKAPRTINWRLRFIVMRRDNFKCKNCGRSPATDPKITLHVDHIKPWSKGSKKHAPSPMHKKDS